MHCNRGTLEGAALVAEGSMTAWQLLVVSGLMTCIGCGGSDGGGPATAGDGGVIGNSIGPDDYVATYCKWHADCQGLSEANCLDELTYFTVGVPGLAEDCAAEFDRLDWLDEPAGCNPGAVGDRTAVWSLCQQVAQAQCKDSQTCDNVTLSYCLDAFDDLVCTPAISARSALPACLDLSLSTPCAVTGADIPECTGVFISG
jgi:hypothetical protein